MITNLENKKSIHKVGRLLRNYLRTCVGTEVNRDALIIDKNVISVSFVLFV